MNYFTGRRDPKVTAREAIVTLRTQLQMLEKKEENLQRKIDEELKKAKTNAVSNKTGKSRAMRACESLDVAWHALGPSSRSLIPAVTSQRQRLHCGARRHTRRSWTGWQAHDSHSRHKSIRSSRPT